MVSNEDVFQNQPNMRNNKDIQLRKQTVQSHRNCLHRCKLLENCDTINYNKETKECELLKPRTTVNGTRIKPELSFENHWIFSEPVCFLVLCRSLTLSRLLYTIFV